MRGTEGTEVFKQLKGLRKLLDHGTRGTQAAGAGTLQGVEGGRK